MEVDLETIKRRSIRGIFALTSRTFILQLVSFVATFILTILLQPSIFGVFFVVSAVISFLGYFSDVGLAASLIQKKEEPTKEDLRTTFFIQEFLVGTVVLIGLLLSKPIASFYNLSEAGVWLLRALLISFFLSSLKTIPSVILERRLDFNRLVIPQVVETFLFYLVAISLAFLGFGVSSFAWAALVRGISGTIIIYYLSPWSISLSFSKESAKRLLSFGVPFQLNSFLALLKDDLMTIFLGKILPFSEIGYIGWAKKWAEMPLRLIMDNVIKVTFPAYSRLQEKPVYLGKAVGKSLFFIAVLIFPIVISLIFLIKPLVFLIPRYQKWEPALVLFYLFSLSAVVASFSSPLTNALAAIGKIRITLYLMVMWTVLTWLLVPFLVFKLGFNGVGYGAVLMSLTIFIVVLVSKKYISFSLVRQLGKPSLATLAMVLAIFFSSRIFASGWLGLIVSAASGFLVYGILILLLAKKEILPEVKELLKR